MVYIIVYSSHSLWLSTLYITSIFFAIKMFISSIIFTISLYYLIPIFWFLSFSSRRIRRYCRFLQSYSHLRYNNPKDGYYSIYIQQLSIISFWIQILDWALFSHLLFYSERDYWSQQLHHYLSEYRR